MAAVSFTLHQVTSLPSNTLYRVKNEVTAAVGASPAVFVFKTMTQKFSHYAAVADMEKWPDNYEMAQPAGLEFYRLSVVERDWRSVTEMQADLAATKSRIQLLASDLARLNNSAVIDETITINGG